jgi:hypothetical protein
MSYSYRHVYGFNNLSSMNNITNMRIGYPRLDAEQQGGGKKKKKGCCGPRRRATTTTTTTKRGEASFIEGWCVPRRLF